jgi:hypothetical protein
MVKILAKLWASACSALTIGAFLFACLQTSATAAAQSKSLDPLTFALSQERDNAGIINFDNNCPGNPTPGLAAAVTGVSPNRIWPAAWQAPCRTLNGADLFTVLKNASHDDGLSIMGVNLVKTPGNKDNRIYLYAQTFPINLSISYSRIADSLDLDNVHLNALDIENTLFQGGKATAPANPVAAIYSLSARNMVLDDSIKLDNDHFADLVTLQEMHVHNYAVLSALDGDYRLLANGASVDGYLFLQNTLQFKEIDLSETTVGKDLQLIGVADSGPLKCQRCAADSLEIGLPAQPPLPFVGDVDFYSSKFHDEISIQYTAFEGLVSFNNVDASDITVSDSSFEKGLSFNYANVTGIAQFSEVTLQSLYLANAKIDRALDMAGVDASSWTPAGGLLDISNTHASTFTDCEATWPARIDLDGFKYDAIGISNNTAKPAGKKTVPCQHIGGSTSSDKGLIDFLSKNYDPDDPKRPFNPQPYTYLANYYTQNGNYQYANGIHYQARVLSMESAWQTGDYTLWFGLSFLWLIAGFGIGDYALLHLSLTIAGSLILGLIVMKRSPRARNRHWFWCLGACAERLLPIVKLLKEFDDYFDDPNVGPDNPALSWRQKLFFSFYALWGWILGFLLVAVISGVIQTS